MTEVRIPLELAHTIDGLLSWCEHRHSPAEDLKDDLRDSTLEIRTVQDYLDNQVERVADPQEPG